jgi:hypothetical protein
MNSSVLNAMLIGLYLQVNNESIIVCKLIVDCLYYLWLLVEDTMESCLVHILSMKNFLVDDHEHVQQ